MEAMLRELCALSRQPPPAHAGVSGLRDGLARVADLTEPSLKLETRLTRPGRPRRRLDAS